MSAQLKPITRDAVLKGRDKAAPLTTEQESNLENLLRCVNALQEYWGREFIITSGYRPAATNTAIGGAKGSAHLSCQAVDISDPHQTLSAWLNGAPNYLVACGLYMESPTSTPTWCHVQIRPTHNRIFNP